MHHIDGQFSGHDRGSCSPKIFHNTNGLTGISLPTSLQALVAILGETLRWAWSRDEVHQPTTRRKVLYFVILYGGWFVIMTALGIILELSGHPAAASGVWFFGFWFSAFIASIDIAWESITYLLERRDERVEVKPESGPTRELARDLRPVRDTWVGFVVTVIALAVLIATWYLALAIAGNPF